MKDSDPRNGYLSLISLQDSRVNMTPHVVFLFGGDRNVTSTVRGLLYNHIMVKDAGLFKSLVIPEDFGDWLEDSAYPDLLTFESDLAKTASLVIIALESAGAIAELGSFSVSDSLKKKVMVILTEEHHKQRSFIRLGPLRQLPEKNILSYPYSYGEIPKSLNPYLDNILDCVRDTLNRGNKEERFDHTNHGHIALLIYELVSLFSALILKEIKSYLLILGVEPSQRDIKRLIFLLTKLEFLDERRRGNVLYYVPSRRDIRFLFASKDKAKRFDRNAARVAASQYYSSMDSESMRRNAIESISGGDNGG